MNVATMRWVDRYAGVPLCHLAGRWNQYAIRFRRPPEEQSGGTVVVLKMFGLGSILLAFPFLSSLRQCRPGARVLFVTFSSNTALVERAPFPIEVLPIRTESFVAFCADALHAIRTIRKRKPREVFDLEFFSKFSTLLCALSGAPRRYGYDLAARWRRLNITHPVPYRAGVHVAELFLDQLPREALRRDPLTVTLGRPSEEEHAALSRMLAADGVDGRRLVAVNVNAGPTSLERRWPLERFAATILAYLEYHPETIVLLTGDGTERHYVQRLFRISPALNGRAFNYAGRLPLGMFLALLERVSWLLTNDSAPMHFAASLGTPVVALFGPESPIMYAPIGNARTLYAGLPCSPCLSVYHAKQFSCPYGALCMRSIATGEVLEAVLDAEREPLAKREPA